MTRFCHALDPCSWRLAGLVVCGAPSAPALAQASDQIEAEVARVGALDKIIEAGIVRIAVPSDLPPFGSRNFAGQIEGYDIDVARLPLRLWACGSFSPRPATVLPRCSPCASILSWPISG